MYYYNSLQSNIKENPTCWNAMDSASLLYGQIGNQQKAKVIFKSSRNSHKKGMGRQSTRRITNAFSKSQ